MHWNSLFIFPSNTWRYTYHRNQPVEDSQRHQQLVDILLHRRVGILLHRRVGILHLREGHLVHIHKCKHLAIHLATCTFSHYTTLYNTALHEKWIVNSASACNAKKHINLLLTTGSTSMKKVQAGMPQPYQIRREEGHQAFHRLVDRQG